MHQGCCSWISALSSTYNVLEQPFVNEVFQGTGNFNLRENDYAFGDLKFGGNARSITKSRWVHHTSFLWDFVEKNMSFLKRPAKVPEYCKARKNLEFISRMKDYMPRSIFMDKTIQALGSHFTVNSTSLEDAQSSTDPNFQTFTKLLKVQELETAIAPSST